MNKELKEKDTPPQGDESSSRFSREVGIREERKLKSRRRQMRSVWTGFGFFGLIGWSIVVPTLIGTAVGRWLDRTYPGERSWTLALLVAGLTLGCFNAWRWISREHREIENEDEEEIADE
jgi:ATP synthase protein I